MLPMVLALNDSSRITVAVHLSSYWIEETLSIVWVGWPGSQRMFSLSSMFRILAETGVSGINVTCSPTVKLSHHSGEDGLA